MALLRELRHRRSIVVYLLAIVAPALVLLYFGVESFERQREALDTLLRANLRLSAEKLAAELERRVKEEAQACLRDVVRNGSAKGGYGLGLYLIRHIVDAHERRVKLDSEPGRGSTFRLVFPQPGSGAASLLVRAPLFAQTFRPGRLLQIDLQTGEHRQLLNSVSLLPAPIGISPQCSRPMEAPSIIWL